MKRLTTWMFCGAALALLVAAPGCGSSVIGFDELSDGGLRRPDGGASVDGGAFDDGGAAGQDGGGDLDGGAGRDGGAGADGGASDGGPVVTLVALALDPSLARVAANTTVQLTATGRYSDGTTAELTSMAVWGSDAPAIATVAAGLVRGVSAGVTQITAKVGALSASATVTVPAATITSIAVTPPMASIAVGATATFQAVATLSDGTTQPLVAPAVLWTSTELSTANIDGMGVATGLRAGRTTLVATAGSLRGQAELVVTGSTLVSLALTPTDPTVGTNTTLTFAATGTYSDGTVADLTRTATWTSSAPGTVSIDASGVARTGSPGTAVITATVGNVGARTTVTVTASPLRTLTVTPPMLSLAPGATSPLIVTGTYADGTTADLTRTATWESTALTVAAVSNADATRGVVTALTPGMATIRARVGDIVGAASVTVLAARLTSLAISPASPVVPLGATVSLVARGTYTDGSVLDVTTSVSWSIDNSALATISNAMGSQGQVRGVTAGMTTVRASLDGQTATAALTVSPATLTSIAIAPANASVAVGVRQTFTATGTFSDGSTVDLTRTAVWATRDTRIATVSNASGAQGQLTGVSAGTTTLTATSGGVTGTTNVTITAATLSQLVVSPVAASRAAGQRIQFAASAVFSNGTQQNVTLQSTWSSSNTMVATVNGQGQATAVAVGTTTITARYNNLTASTPFTVTSATPVQLQIAPVTLSLVVGQAAVFAATAVMSDNTSQNVTMQATWTSSAPAVLRFGGGGGGGPGGGGSFAQALSAGTATVTVSWMGLTSSMTVTVTDAVPVSLVVSPATVSEAVGTSRQFTAQAIYSDNTSRDVTGQATWVSSAPTIVGVNDAAGGPGGGGPGGGQRGLATALSAGTATIRATWSGLSATATFVVTAATLTAIVVSPSVQSAPAGTQRLLTAQAIYSDQTSMDVTNAATWTSSAPNIAAVSTGGGGPGGGGQRGLVSALAMGTATITASWGGRSGTAAFTVTAATVSTIQVTPIQPSVSVGTPVLFAATAIFSDNTTQPVTGQATWTSSAVTVAVVSTGGGTRGIAQTLSAGTTTIGATWNGVAGTTVLTVTPATLRTIQVTPFAPTLPVGFNTRLTATGIYSDNSTQDLTGLATWTSSAPTVASVSTAMGSRGLVTPLSAGTATISATYAGVTGTTAVTVTSATLVSIEVAPATATVRRFASQAFTAIGTFSDMSRLEVTTYVTWLSSTPSIADVSNAAGSQGVAKGLSTGMVSITAVRGNVTGRAALTVTD